MQIRIAIYSRTKNFWGGSFQYAKAFTEALDNLEKENFDIRVWHLEDEEWSKVCNKLNFKEYLCSTYDIPDEFAEEAKKIQDKLQSLGPDQREERIKLLQILQPYSAEAKISKFHPHLIIQPQMGNTSFLKGAKHICVIHDLMHRYETRFPEVGEGVIPKARDQQYKSMIQNADAIIVDSPTGAKHVRECYKNVRNEQLKILPFAAFEEVILCDEKKPNFNIPEKFFFYPAQFWLHKNHLGLAKAINILKNDFPNMVFITAGNTQQNGYEQFHEFVENENLNKHFICPGYLPTENLVWLYKHARALVMPTFFGPTNIPPLEAMALDCPVAISNIYGMPEQCKNAALYFNPDDPQNIASILKKLWTDDNLCQDLIVKGQEHTKIYNVNTFKKQALRIVKEVLEIK